MKMIITMMIGLLGFTYADINLWNGSYVWNRENITQKRNSIKLFEFVV